MGNKDYQRVTIPNTEIYGKAGSTGVYRRLYDLENAIGDGKLVFLPFKVGDEFWCLADYGMEYVVTRHIVQEIRILNNVIYLYDECDNEYDTDDEVLYFTKEEAEKALEELEK